MTQPGRLSRDLTLEPVRERGGWRLSWTWWELVNVRTPAEGWDKLNWPSTDAAVYPTREAADAALAAHRATGALPPMEKPEYGPT